jgi:Flp pilus assembly protein TadG
VSRRREVGQDLIEYALVFPVLMLLLLGIIDFGRIIYSYNAISNAAREAARLAILPSSKVPLSQAVVLAPLTRCSDGAASNVIIARVCERAMALNDDALRVTVSQPDPATVQVQVVYEGPFLTNAVLQAVKKGGLRLQAAATMRLE